MKGVVGMRNVAMMAVVMMVAGSAGAQTVPITISPNQQAGDDVTETVIEIGVTDDHSVTTEIDNSVADDHSIGEQVVSVQADYTKHRAESAPEAHGTSVPLDHPCGDATGMSAQTGIAGGGIATVSEACRAFRVDEYQRRSTSRARSRAVALAYWAGYPTRLALAIVTGGALN